jgi:hypothetical protein
MVAPLATVIVLPEALVGFNDEIVDGGSVVVVVVVVVEVVVVEDGVGGVKIVTLKVTRCPGQVMVTVEVLGFRRRRAGPNA